MSSLLPTPEPDRDAVLAFVGHHLAGLYSGPLTGSHAFVGGQSHADAALARFDVTGYANNRNEVWPAPRRGASGLSPYIRHGYLQLSRVWNHVSGPDEDVARFREELMWQEYARHWYARLGGRSATSVRNDLAGSASGAGRWDRSMACLDMCVEELEDDGWLVNQARMWLASHWSVRQGGRWVDGEDEFFIHLLDGSRAANRLGWQWTTGAGSSKTYGFSRWQVEKRAPGLCGQCDRSADCPIEHWPSDPELIKLEPEPLLRRTIDPIAEAGPHQTERSADPEIVWLTGESLGDDDPVLRAHPDLPVVFVFDEPLLRRLALSAKRLVFLTEGLAELAVERPVELHRSRPGVALAGRAAAVTFAPVPGFRRLLERRADPVHVAELHPYPWLRRPTGGTVSSFSAWRQRVSEPAGV